MLNFLRKHGKKRWMNGARDPRVRDLNLDTDPDHIRLDGSMLR